MFKEKIKQKRNMQQFYEPEEFSYFNHFKESNTVSSIINKIHERDPRDSVDLFYFIAQNEYLLSSDTYIQVMSEIFTIFREKDLLEEAIYNFLDGTCDYWGKEAITVRFLNQSHHLKKIEERHLDKIKNLLLQTLPMLGETKILDYYQTQLENVFLIESY